MARYKLINILTEGFHSSNGRAFLSPLIQYRQALKEYHGIELRFYTQRDASLNQCDVLLVDSKFYKPYWASPKREEAIAHFSDDYKQAGKCIFVDLNDSTGWVVPHVLPYVDIYLKSQLARDRTLYATPLYEHRPHSDYYHRKLGIRNNEDIWSLAITDPAHLDKMKVGWNSGLTNYTMTGPWLMALYERTGLKPFIRRPSQRSYTAPTRPRSIDISYRFGVSYPQDTLKHQRLRLQEIIADRFTLPTRKLNRVQYYQEMRATRICVSPFGYGEITLKDFETFICGATLMKPALDFMETWPNFFQPDSTYVPFSWDLDDVNDKIQLLLDNPQYALDIATAGQQLYYKYVTSSEAAHLFCEHLMDIVS